MKKKITALVLVVAVLAMLFTGMTLAYFTDTESAVNVFTVGDVDIELDETVGVTDSNGNPAPDRVIETETGATYTGIMPGNYMEKTVTVTNKENPAYVRVTVIVNNYDLIDAIGTYYEKQGYSEAQIQEVIDEVFDGWHIEFSHYPNGTEKDMRMAIPNAELADIDDDLLKVDSTFTTIQGSFHYSLANWFKTNHEAERAASGSYDAGHDTGFAGGYYAQHLNDYELCYTYYLDMDKGDTATLFNGLSCPTYFDQEQAAMFNGLNIEIYAAAIQQEGFADEMAAFEQLDKEYPINVMRASTIGTLVSTDEELKAALAANEEEIVVTLTDDVTYDVAAWAANGMGGESTKTITINGNGNTLTFNQTNSDWNNVVTANNATLVLNNVNITNAGHNDGPWNRHDINFACNVEMNTVNSDKALAFKAGAALTNVTIDDANTSDTYAVWIQPNGQTVTLDGCTIDMVDCTDGRGIKIDEQYVAAPAKVTLVVKNTKFVTEEKSAILVKSVAGADITLENVDIRGVAADSTNVVWVDEASAEYADLVTVTGGTKIVES